MKVYIAGPITGTTDYVERFSATAEALRKMGHLPMHTAGLPQGFEHDEYMRISMAALACCDAVCAMPGSTESKGACMEMDYAMHRHMEEIFYIDVVPYLENRAEQVRDLYNEICGDKLPKIEKLTPARRKAILRNKATLSEYRLVFEIVAQSHFLTGGSERGWKAGFDWIMKPANWQKIKEGSYSAVPKCANPALEYGQKHYSDQDLAHIIIRPGGSHE